MKRKGGRNVKDKHCIKPPYGRKKRDHECTDWKKLFHERYHVVSLGKTGKCMVP